MAISQAPYPPIVDTWCPAAVKGEGIKIYFSLSAYNSIQDIRRDIVLVDIMNIVTNESVVNVAGNRGRSQLIAGLSAETDGSYSVTILDNYVKVSANQTYKAQLRLCSSACTASAKDIQERPSNYREYLSEYSGATLIKIISRPELRITSFPVIDVNSEYIISTSSLTISGELAFAASNSTETGDHLDSYSIIIYENETTRASENDKVFFQSGTIYAETKDLNSFYYPIKKDIRNDTHYLMQFSYTTASGYMATESYYFKVLYEADFDCAPPYVFTTMDKEDGSILVEIQASNITQKYQGFFILRRASSLDNFETWQDLKFYRYDEPKIIQERLRDYLVEAGVIYRYQVIPMNFSGYRGTWGTTSQSAEQMLNIQ